MNTAWLYYGKIIFYLILTPTGISGGRLLSVEGDLQAGDEAPLLAPDAGPVTMFHDDLYGVVIKLGLMVSKQKQ